MAFDSRWDYMLRKVGHHAEGDSERINKSAIAICLSHVVYTTS